MGYVSLLHGRHGIKLITSAAVHPFQTTTSMINHVIWPFVGTTLTTNVRFIHTGAILYFSKLFLRNHIYHLISAWHEISWMIHECETNVAWHIETETRCWQRYIYHCILYFNILWCIDTAMLSLYTNSNRFTIVSIFHELPYKHSHKLSQNIHGLIFDIYVYIQFIILCCIGQLVYIYMSFIYQVHMPDVKFVQPNQSRETYYQLTKTENRKFPWRQFHVIFIVFLYLYCTSSVMA